MLVHDRESSRMQFITIFQKHAGQRAAWLRTMGEFRHLEVWQCGIPSSIQRPIISCCGASLDRHQLKLSPWLDAQLDGNQ